MIRIKIKKTNPEFIKIVKESEKQSKNALNICLKKLNQLIFQS